MSTYLSSLLTKLASAARLCELRIPISTVMMSTSIIHQVLSYSHFLAHHFFLLDSQVSLTLSPPKYLFQLRWNKIEKAFMHGNKNPGGRTKASCLVTQSLTIVMFALSKYETTWIPYCFRLKKTGSFLWESMCQSFNSWVFYELFPWDKFFQRRSSLTIAYHQVAEQGRWSIGSGFITNFTCWLRRACRVCTQRTLGIWLLH